MTKNHLNKTAVIEPIEPQQPIGFVTRFAMEFESLFIVFITAVLIWLTGFVDAPEFLIRLFNEQQHGQLEKVIIQMGILAFGLLILLVRYNLYSRKQMAQQCIVEEDIKKRAFFDSLTHLPNKELGQNRLDHALARASVHQTSIAILLISIDNFKAVNDQHGHDGGDKLLQKVAKRLSRELRTGDTLARITGVEFLIILETASPQYNINGFANKLLVKLAKGYQLATQHVYITCNIGIALYPGDGVQSKELIKYAYTAMRFAREQGDNNVAFFSKALQEQANTKKQIAEQLRGAIEKNELMLHYQPVVASHSNNVIAVEALLRWNNQLLGNIAPDVFIPIAEEIGIIKEIGDWVLVQACLQNKIWQQQGYPNMVMSINMSAMQLCIEGYANTVAEALTDTQLAPQYLELEFTENMLMKEVKQSIVQLKQLSALGVSIALDDFGTGYSSLKHLARFKINKLKIDGCFIKNIAECASENAPESAEGVMATKAIIALAKQFKLHITAEEVETANQREFLAANGVDSMQGCHFSKAVDANGFEQLLKSPSWH